MKEQPRLRDIRALAITFAASRLRKRNVNLILFQFVGRTDIFDPFHIINQDLATLLQALLLNNDYCCRSKIYNRIINEFFLYAFDRCPPNYWIFDGRVRYLGIYEGPIRSTKRNVLMLDYFCSGELKAFEMLTYITATRCAAAFNTNR
jgi:hypothetical protein